MVDVTDYPERIELKVEQFRAIIQRECHENIVIFLLGNKVDLGKSARQLTTSMGRQVVRDHEMDKYVEISALHNIKVCATIDEILIKIQKKALPQKDLDDNISITTANTGLSRRNISLTNDSSIAFEKENFGEEHWA